MNNNSPQLTPLQIDPIGIVDSPYKEKFAIPRQPGLVTAAKGKITLLAPYNQANMVKGLSEFSHVWLLFHFHQTASQGWKPLVRPPRLGGNEKMGVLATRSTFRPNGIGMSVVKLEDIETKVGTSGEQVTLHISALDLLDKTPIIDIKPYIPYADAKQNAEAGFANNAPNTLLSVYFCPQAQQQLVKHEKKYNDLTTLIKQVLAQDPRPAYKQKSHDEKIYGIRLYQLNIRWQLQSQSEIIVLSIDDA